MTTLPSIHLNGTGAKTLFKEYREAWYAAKAARKALADATCNGRDFYPLGGDAWGKARAERVEQLAHLDQLIEYLEAWTVHALDHAQS